MPVERICGAHIRLLEANSAQRRMVHGKPEALAASSTALKASAKRFSPPPSCTVTAESSTTRCAPCSAESFSSSAVAAPAVASPRARGLIKTVTTPPPPALHLLCPYALPPHTPPPS